MNYEQMFAAMGALRLLGTALHMRKPGDWYVSFTGVEIKDRSTLQGAGKSGSSPEDAITKTWIALTTLDGDKRIVINALADNRREVRWNGFMWEDYTA